MNTIINGETLARLLNEEFGTNLAYNATLLCYYTKLYLHWEQVYYAKPGDRFYQRNINDCIEKAEKVKELQIHYLNKLSKSMFYINARLKNVSEGKAQLLEKFIPRDELGRVNLITLQQIADEVRASFVESGIDFDGIRWPVRLENLANR